MATIILTGGGSAGHVTPHLALLPYLKDKFNKIYYIGSENGLEKNIIEKVGIPYYSVPTAKLARKFTVKNFTIPLTVSSGIRQAGKLLDKLSPDVVFSKGGYVSVPTVIAASKRKIPVILHESDFTIGLANKICARGANRVLTSFPETAKTIKNGEYTGSPIRKFNRYDKVVLRRFFGFNSNKPTLLVTGGSQGAKKINNTVRIALPQLVKTFNVIHLCGKGNLDDSVNIKGYYQAEYLTEVDKAFCLADVCVCRAGANTLFEAFSQNIPCLLIPLPLGVSRGDQVLNAKHFEKLGLCSVLEQDALTPSSLVCQANAIYAGADVYKNNFIKSPVKDASKNIAEIILHSLQ